MIEVRGRLAVRTTLVALVLSASLAFLSHCGSSPARTDTSQAHQEETTVVPSATPVHSEPSRDPPTAVPQPVPHSGPIRAEPNVHDCGLLRPMAVCDVEIILDNPSAVPLDILRIAQDFSPWARIGLVADLTGFDRTLPYTMAPEERLRLLFHYRQDHEEAPTQGSLHLRYSSEGTTYSLEIPIVARH